MPPSDFSQTGTAVVNLSWAANAETDIAGYKVYYDTASGSSYEGKGAKEGDSPIDVGNTTNFSLSDLQAGIDYYFTVTAYDKDGNESWFSRELNVKTESDLHPPAKPTNIAPTNDAKDISLTPMLESSDFLDEDPNDKHVASQWQITTVSGDYTNAVYDSGRDTINKNSITIPAGILLPGTGYYWRIRHQNHRGVWSDYSKETYFTTQTMTTANTYQVELSLAKGINMISLSLKPESSWTAKSIVQELDATLVIRAVDGNFKAYIDEGDIGEDFPIEANKGYIVNVTKPVNYTLWGKPWGDPVAVPSIETENPTWAFVVTGVIAPNIADITKIVNLRTGESTTAKIKPNGRFTAVFVDFSRRSVVQVDDAIELSFIDRHGNLLSKIIRRIEPEQVERAYLNTVIELRPTQSVLLPNYPNPFNPETWIPYQIAQDAQVTIEIFNIAGELIRSIELGNQTAGWYVTKDRAAFWNGRNNAGEGVASGIYFYKLRAGDYSAVRKMLIAK